MMKKITLLLLQAFLVFMSLGCFIAGQANQDQADTNSPDQVPSDFELLAEGIKYGIRVDSGTEKLTNYRVQAHFRANGVDDNGASFDGFQEYLREIDNTGDASREIETLQVPNPYLAGTHEWVEYEGFSYYVHDVFQGGRICEKSEIPADTSHYSDANVIQILLTITPGENIEKNVRVNGVLADVYEIDDVSLLFARELHNVIGKVWIAQEPAYFIKAEGTIEGVLEFENILYNGNATFSYEIKDFDQVEIQLPALCANPPEELIPRPSNIKDVVNFSEMITFTSPDSVDQVKRFYLNELVAQGWQVEEASNTFEEVLQTSITTQEGIQIVAEVTIIAMGDGSTHVRISWQAH